MGGYREFYALKIAHQAILFKIIFDYFFLPHAKSTISQFLALISVDILNSCIFSIHYPLRFCRAGTYGHLQKHMLNFSTLYVCIF